MAFKIIASLTTIPSRISKISETIKSILDQSIPIHGIEINVPYIFERNNEEYIIPDWLIDLEENTRNSECPVKVYRTDIDYGPATKVVPTFLRYKDAIDKENIYVWSLDDDFNYPKDMLANSLKLFKEGDKKIISHSVCLWKIDPNNQNCLGIVDFRKEREIHLEGFAEGYASILYPVSAIEDDFPEYVLKAIQNPFCKNGDDVILSNYFIMKGIPIHNRASPNPNFFRVAKHGLKYGFMGDALHKQSIGNEERYIKIYNWLSENNLNCWTRNK